MKWESILLREDVPEDVKQAIRKELSLTGKDELLNLREQALTDVDSLLNVSPESSLLLKKNGKIITLNEVAATRLGETVDNLLGKNIFEYFSPGVRENRKKFITEAIIKKIPIRFSDSRNGMVFENWIHPILNNQNEVVRIAVFASDITNMIEANQALIESEEKYRTLVERATDGIAIIQDGIVKFLNTSLAEMSGQQVQDVIGTRFEHNIHPDAMREVIQRYKDRMSGIAVPSIYETSLVRVNGEKIEVELNAGIITFQNHPADLVFVRDISERKRIGKELGESEEKFRTLITTMGEGVWMTDSRDRTIFVNNALESMLGYSEDELMGRLVTDFLAPSSWKKFEEVVKMRFEKQSLSSTYELTWIKKDGNPCTTRIAGTVLLDEDERISASFGVFTDITLQKSIEQSLQESEEQYRNLVERANDGIAIIQDHKIAYVNPSLAHITGFSIPELIGEFFADFLHPDVIPEVEDFYRRRMAGEDVPSIYESLIRKKDGSKSEVEFNVGLTTYQGSTAELVFVRNVSDRKRAERLLTQVKLEEERYHAMLSHFVNNDLQKIVNNLDFIRLEMQHEGTTNPENIPKIINIAKQSSRTIDTVNKIFDVLKSPEREFKSLYSILEVIEQLFQENPELKSCTTLENSSLDRLLLCDKYLQTALFEILQFIQTSCDEEKLQNFPIKIEGGLLAAYYRIVVRDSCSPPISEEVSYRLSSKITDNWEYQGHYIGLSLCSVIMQHYGGTLKILPLVNQGNEFQLLFPSILVSSKV
ncbi:MAG: PAS domain S-box protein [Candidatus Hodarchaeales archaeon]|jgi:PAS domain S-box-containing protein